MHLRTLLGASALACIAIGCSSSSNGDNENPDSTVADSSVTDAHADTRDGGSDTRDGGQHDTFDGGPDTNPEFDTNPVDIGPGDSSGLFPCGSDSCNTLLQFCEVDPGCAVIPAPPPDAGDDGAVDSDGDAIDDTSIDTGPPDTGTCARHCVTYAEADASTCLGFPSCACITSALCGSKGSSCDDSSGGVIVSCNP